MSEEAVEVEIDRDNSIYYIFRKINQLLGIFSISCMRK